MLSRCQRFLARVRGTQLMIFLLILGYDVYLYVGMVQAGLLWFVAMVVPPGIIIGSLAAHWLARSPNTLIKLMNAAGYSTMAIFLLTRGANVFFPLWVYGVGHALLWFWFTTFFLHASRPYDFSFWFENSEEDAEPEQTLA